MTNDMREAFEKWAIKPEINYDITRNDAGGYKDTATFSAWFGFQAAWNDRINQPADDSPAIFIDSDGIPDTHMFVSQSQPIGVESVQNRFIITPINRDKLFKRIDRWLKIHEAHDFDEGKPCGTCLLLQDCKTALEANNLQTLQKSDTMISQGRINDQNSHQV